MFDGIYGSSHETKSSEHGAQKNNSVRYIFQIFYVLYNRTEPFILSSRVHLHVWGEGGGGALFNLAKMVGGGCGEGCAAGGLQTSAH